MFYVTYNKPKKISNSLMDKMVTFASDFLQVDGELEIYFDGEFNNGCCGYVEYESDDELIMYINPQLNKKDIVTTFFHEMVHVKQYLHGELKSGIGKSASRWKGKKYDMSYYESPWEVEAYEYEKVMTDIFKQEGFM